MENQQRIDNDLATMNKRELTDKIIKENRIKNDQLTIKRRDKADKLTDENRLRNDEITAHRREINDGHINITLAVFLSILILLFLASVVYFFFVK